MTLLLTVEFVVAHSNTNALLFIVIILRLETQQNTSEKRRMRTIVMMNTTKASMKNSRDITQSPKVPEANSTTTDFLILDCLQQSFNDICTRMKLAGW